MGDEKQEFRFREVLELEDLADYLEEVSKGISSGRLTLSAEDEDGIDVELPASVRFAIAAKSKPEKGKIAIELKWKQPKPEDEAALEINGTAPAANGGSAGYESLTREELYEKASALDIEGRSSMTKAELLDAVRTHEAAAETAAH